MRPYLEGRDGASPATCREFVRQLLVRLPDPVRKEVGRILQQEMSPAEINFDLNRIRDGSLDQPIPDIAVFSLGSPQEAITTAVAKIVKDAKGRQTRRRPGEVDEQLKVWDLREGWTGHGYDGQQERRLCDISKTIRAPLSTVKDRYKRAFAHVVGRPFDTKLWMMLFLSLKLESSLRKAWRVRGAKSQTREVPLTRLRLHGKQSDKRDGEPSDAPTTKRVNSDCDQPISEFHTHMTELLGKGMPVADVATRLAIDFEITMTPEDKDCLIEYITNAPNRLE
jgi:hypothetical protein